MRYSMMTLAAIAAVAATATSFASTPATAREYPYCIQGGGFGIPGDCSYASYEQCKATASGRLVYCNVNPRFAFEQQRQQQQSQRRGYYR